MKKYYTLEDLIKKQMDTWADELDFGEIIASYLPTLVGTFTEITISNTSPVKQTKANELFCRYIAPRYKRMVIEYSTEGESEEQLYAEWIRNFIYVLNATYDRHAQIINIYENEKNNLMSDIISYSESKYNDTPQNAQGTSYDFTTDDHLTSVTRNESGSQIASKISRISEIDQFLKNYYAEWAKEFGGLFWYE